MGGVKYLLKSDKEPTILPTFLVMHCIYEFHLRCPNRRSRHGNARFSLKINARNVKEQHIVTIFTDSFTWQRRLMLHSLFIVLPVGAYT